MPASYSYVCPLPIHMYARFLFICMPASYSYVCPLPIHMYARFLFICMPASYSYVCPLPDCTNFHLENTVVKFSFQETVQASLFARDSIYKQDSVLEILFSRSLLAAGRRDLFFVLWLFVCCEKFMPQLFVVRSTAVCCVKFIA